MTPGFWFWKRGMLKISMDFNQYYLWWHSDVLDVWAVWLKGSSAGFLYVLPTWCFFLELGQEQGVYYDDDDDDDE